MILREQQAGAGCRREALQDRVVVQHRDTFEVVLVLLQHAPAKLLREAPRYDVLLLSAKPPSSPKGTEREERTRHPPARAIASDARPKQVFERRVPFDGVREAYVSHQSGNACTAHESFVFTVGVARHSLLAGSAGKRGEIRSSSVAPGTL